MIGIALCDATGRFLHVNRALESVLGRDARSLALQPLTRVVQPNFLPEGRTLTDEIAGSPDGAYRVERRYRKPSGELCWIRLTASLAQGRILALFEDITARVDATERQGLQAALLDAVPDAILVLDMENRVRYWSGGAERLYGFTAREMTGEDPDLRLCRERAAADGSNAAVQDRRNHGVDGGPSAARPALRAGSGQPVLAEAERATLTRGAWSGSLRRVGKDGKDRVVESRWSLLRDDGGTAVGMLVIDTDVSEKAHIEAQLFRTQRLESIGLLAGGVAHDINNLLTPILMATGLLRRRIEDESLVKLIATIESKVLLGAGLVKQILHFARGATGARTLLQVRHLVHEVETFARDTFPRSIAIRSDAPKELWTVTGDATQLYQVLMNLCVNARDAMPGGGELTLTARNLVADELFATTHGEALPGRYVVISVKDTGTGMPPDVLERIFEPFFTTKDVDQGTGLGLSTTLGIVKSHGGFVTVDTAPGAGSTFHVHVPADTDGADVVTSPVEREMPEGRGRCVLVVDDERDIREVAETALTSWGYRVISAADGAEAVAAYAQARGEVDLVLLDMAMPYMDGPNTMRALRRLDANVKIVLTSGFGERRRGEEAGAYPFLAKPYTTDQLLETIGRALIPEE